MTKEEFRACFEDWLKYKPARVKDWPQMGGVYFKALGGFRAAELQIALDRLIETSAEFPTIAKIKNLVLDREDGEAGGNSDHDPEVAANVLLGVRLCEHKLGLPAAPPTDYPSWLSDLAERAVASAKQEVATLVREHYITIDQALAKQVNYATGAINILVRRHVS